MWEWIQNNPSLFLAAAGAGAGIIGWAYSVHYTLKEISKTLKAQPVLVKQVNDHEVRITVLEQAA